MIWCKFQDAEENVVLAEPERPRNDNNSSSGAAEELRHDLVGIGVKGLFGVCSHIESLTLIHLCIIVCFLLCGKECCGCIQRGDHA